MPDQVKKVLRKMQTEGFFSTLEKVQAKLDQPIPLGFQESLFLWKEGGKVGS